MMLSVERQKVSKNEAFEVQRSLKTSLAGAAVWQIDTPRTVPR